MALILACIQIAQTQDELPKSEHKDHDYIMVHIRGFLHHERFRCSEEEAGDLNQFSLTFEPLVQFSPGWNDRSVRSLSSQFVEMMNNERNHRRNNENTDTLSRVYQSEVTVWNERKILITDAVPSLVGRYINTSFASLRTKPPQTTVVLLVSVKWEHASVERLYTTTTVSTSFNQTAIVSTRNM